MTQPEGWEIASMGDSALLMSWRGSQAQDAVRLLQARLATLAKEQALELVPGIASLLVCFDPGRHEPARLQNLLQSMLEPVSLLGTSSPRIVSVEVQYGGEHGVDLPFVAAACGLTPDEVIALHTACPMPVLMLGFMPGFPYIGDLPVGLRLPRRAAPRTAVPAGSVALANDQTGIYPARSPGGWHIIGRTDARLFDPRRDPPALLMVGDLVQFVADNTL